MKRVDGFVLLFAILTVKCDNDEAKRDYEYSCFCRPNYIFVLGPVNQKNIRGPIGSIAFCFKSQNAAGQ